MPNADAGSANRAAVAGLCRLVAQLPGVRPRPARAASLRCEVFVESRRLVGVHHRHQVLRAAGRREVHDAFGESSSAADCPAAASVRFVPPGPAVAVTASGDCPLIWSTSR